MMKWLSIVVGLTVVQAWMPALWPACRFGEIVTAQSLRSAASEVLLINEVMASNSSSITDPQGHFDDWIELHNPGPAAVDVAGMYLTDDLSEPTKWQIPYGRSTLTVIPPKGYLLIWADGDTTAAGLHAGFSLSASGEQVAFSTRTAGPSSTASIRRPAPRYFYVATR